MFSKASLKDCHLSFFRSLVQQRLISARTHPHGTLQELPYLHIFVSIQSSSGRKKDFPPERERERGVCANLSGCCRYYYYYYYYPCHRLGFIIFVHLCLNLDPSSLPPTHRPNQQHRMFGIKSKKTWLLVNSYECVRSILKWKEKDSPSTAAASTTATITTTTTTTTTIRVTGWVSSHLRTFPLILIHHPPTHRPNQQQMIFWEERDHLVYLINSG
jgi:hypothetical protein